MTSFPETLNGSRMAVFFIARKVKLYESSSKAEGEPILIRKTGVNRGNAHVFYPRVADAPRAIPPIGI